MGEKLFGLRRQHPHLIFRPAWIVKAQVVVSNV
jgi:hypothetical protein